MLSDRSRPFWATNFALQYFGLPREALQRVVGINGRLWMCRWCETIGDQIYHQPEFALRQEWVYDRLTDAKLMAFRKIPPIFFEQYLTDGVLFDFGCGTAESERKPWIDQGKRTILMDLAGPNFEYTKAKYAGYNVEYRPVGADLPAEYDGLLLLDVLEHVPNPLALWADLWGRLKPGGVAAVWFDQSRATGHLEESMVQYPEWHRRTESACDWLLRRPGCDILHKPTRKTWWKPW